MKQLFFFGILIITYSCAMEKINFSPLSYSFYNESKRDRDKKANKSINIKKNVNASEISNLISFFPKFKNTNINEEITELKYSLQNYLYAIDAGNNSGKNRAIKNFEKAYKNIQKKRQNLNKDDDEVLNRYLVRLKTNICIMEDSLKEEN